MNNEIGKKEDKKIKSENKMNKETKSNDDWIEEKEDIEAPQGKAGFFKEHQKKMLAALLVVLCLSGAYYLFTKSPEEKKAEKATVFEQIGNWWNKKWEQFRKQDASWQAFEAVTVAAVVIGAYQVYTKGFGHCVSAVRQFFTKEKPPIQPAQELSS